MKGVVHPSDVSNVVPVSLPFCPDSSENEHTFGLISESSLWMCLVHNTSIHIFSTETGRWCSSYCFAESVKNPSARVTSILEFSSSHIPFQSLLVSVDQDCENLLCMFNVDTGKVVQAILIPEKISSMDIVSGDGGVCMETRHLNARLRYMFGVVVIGTVNGHIYFLDLCLDESFSCDEATPNITLVLKQHTKFSAPRREAALSRKQHIFLRLNDENDLSGKYELQNSILSDAVTAVKYFKSLATIAVGYSSGKVQLWELQHLTLQFTIPGDSHHQPIVNFAFQEPENDPRNFCYLWVFRGHSVLEKNPPNTLSCAAMYSITFFKRDHVKSFGTLYSELQTCTKRYEFPFSNDIYHCSLINSAVTSRLLSCQVISQKDLSQYAEIYSGNETCEASEDMSLCFISWEVWSPCQNVPASYHFAVFDLNQWYQAQMPCTFRCDPSSLSPYFGVFSLDETKRVLNKQTLLGQFVIPQSIKKFKSLSVSEEFFYPSSLGFQTINFSHSGLCKTTYFGFQRHLLFEMAELGPKVLINPKEVFSSLIKCGLVADNHGGADRTPLISQKEALLQLALEYNLPFFFIKCMKEWRYSDSIHEYCTSRGLLNWAWKKVMFIKNSIDRLCLSLFNCSGVDVDKSSLKSLYAFRKQLNSIDRILAGYQKFVTPRTDQGIQDLECRRDALSCINIYLQVLLWLRSVHVLPEVCEVEASPENVVYRIDSISKLFAQRRSLLQALNSSIGIAGVLLIDGMVSETGINSSWQEKGGSGLYPPPSIYAALSSYLLSGVSPELKHALIYYLLLDIQDSAENADFHLAVEKFPIMFGMSKCTIKLVEAFWFLDRKDCDNALRKLLDPSIKPVNILLWQHHRIIRSFLYYRTPEKALKYINHMAPPQNTYEDMRLHLSVLLACGAISQAFEYQRKKQREGYGNDLLRHLFLGCKETNKMRELINLPLNSLESSILIQFLSESEDPRDQEVLVIYHLLHCNFFEAEKINGKLSLTLMKSNPSSSELLINERSLDRNSLVESLLSGIPKAEKSLVEEINRLPPKNIAIREESLKPLSVSITTNPQKQMSYADLLTSMLYAPPLIEYPQTPLKPNFGSPLQELPFIRRISTPKPVKTPAIFKNKNNDSAVNKRSLLCTSPNEYSLPAKRSRLLDNATFKETPTSKRKAPKHLAGDIASLLQTPPIRRRVSLVKSDSLTTPLKPQSILKKSVAAAIIETVQDIHRAETPPLLSEDQNSEDGDMHIDENNSEQIEADSEQSKQIRFDIPFTEQSISEDMATVSEITAVGEDLNSSVSSPSEETSRSWKKSLPSLTREPLVEYLKHSPVSADNVSSTKNMSAIPEPQESESRNYSKSNDPMLTSASIQSQIVDVTAIESEMDSAMNVDQGDSLLHSSSSKFITQSSVHEHITAIYQRKNVTPRAHLRSEIPSSENKLVQEMECDPENVINNQNVTSSEPNVEISSSGNTDHSQQYGTVIEPLYEENTVIAEDSNDDMFYSPYSPSSAEFSNFSERLGEPIKFLSDTSLCKKSQPEKLETLTTDENPSRSKLSVKKKFIFSGYSISNSPARGEDNSKVIAKPDGNKYAFSGLPDSSNATEMSSNTASQAAELLKEDEDEVVVVFDTKSAKNMESFHVEKREEQSCSFFSKGGLEKDTRKEKLIDSPSVSQENRFVTSMKAKDPIQEFRRPTSMPRLKQFVFTGLQESCDASENNRSIPTEAPQLVQEDEDEVSIVFDTKSSKNLEFSQITQTEKYSEFSNIISKSTPEEDSVKENTKQLLSSLCVQQENKSTISSEAKDLEQPAAVQKGFLIPKPISKPSRRQFSFTGLKDSSDVPEKSHSTVSQSTQLLREIGEEVDVELSNTKPSKIVEFLEAAQAETYEEFTNAFSKSTPSEDTEKRSSMKLLSSPCTSQESASTARLEDKVPKDQDNSNFQIPAVIQTPTNPVKSVSKSKKKKKGKVVKKMEFSFAEPTSPATPDILEALSKVPEQPLPSFLFSPPLTRGRLRQKRLDETMGSSFSSVISETSFAAPSRKPPIDPILEDLMQERSLQMKGSVKKSSTRSTKKKNAQKPKLRETIMDISDQSLLSFNESTASLFSTPPSQRHSMILRQTRSKQK